MTEKTKTTKTKELKNNGGKHLQQVKADAIRNYKRHLAREEEELEDKLAEQGQTLEDYYAELDKPRPKLSVLRKKLSKKG